MPIEIELNREWVNAINKINDERHKCNGSGWLCNLHFDVNSIIKSSSGKLQLKNNTVPVIFESSHIQSSANENETVFAQNAIEVEVLNSESE